MKRHLIAVWTLLMVGACYGGGSSRGNAVDSSSASSSESVVKDMTRDRESISGYVASRHGANTDHEAEGWRWLADVTWQEHAVIGKRVLVAKATEIVFGNRPRTAFYGWVSATSGEGETWQAVFEHVVARDDEAEVVVDAGAGSLVIKGRSHDGKDERQLLSVDLKREKNE